MSHRVSEGARMAILIFGTLAMSVALCLILAGALSVLLRAAPSAAPELSVLMGLLALAAGYFGFRWMVGRLFGATYG